MYLRVRALTFTFAGPMTLAISAALEVENILLVVVTVEGRGTGEPIRALTPARRSA